MESNVYANRASEGQILIRVMIGGAHHPGIINDSHEQILSKAIKEIDTVYGLIDNPLETFVKLWPKAIPQYDINYPNLRQSISETLRQNTGFIPMCQLSRRHIF